MCEEDAKVSIKLDFDDLDSVSGGVILEVNDIRNGEQTYWLGCPKCRSGSLNLGPGCSEYSKEWSMRHFLSNINLMCLACGFSGSGSEFALERL